nr:protein arginine methyltransferase NDUFAF7, mitochondrial-like [Cherax quadricarinatus]
MCNFSDVFTDIPGVTSTVVHKIDLVTDNPIKRKLYPVPVHFRDAFDREVDKLLKLKIIEPSVSAYCSPVVMVKKKDNSCRLAIDFRGLNAILRWDAEAMPLIDSDLHKFYDSSFFSEIDIVQAYQVMLDPSSKQYTTFPTHQGLMQYRTMPFGLVTACATYVRLMRKVLDDYEKELYFKKSTTTGGSPVFWYRHLGSVPRSFSVFLANEFFDVLPIHKICKTEDGWREVLIDIDEGDGPHHLRYVLSRAETPATKVFIQPEETRDEIEVSPDAAVLCEELASRIEEDGGIALIMDYGHDGKDSSTFRAFKNHALHDPLCEPGTADLTADVDFAHLKGQIQERVITYGPVTQSSFLTNMGIEFRLANLMKHCHLDEQKSLISGFKMLTDPLKMGTRFKFLAFFPAAVKDFLKKHPPAGFYRYED